MRVFVPFEDFSTDGIWAPLVPYRSGLPCEHALRAHDAEADVGFLPHVRAVDGSTLCHTIRPDTPSANIPT